MFEESRKVSLSFVPADPVLARSNNTGAPRWTGLQSPLSRLKGSLKCHRWPISIDWAAHPGLLPYFSPLPQSHSDEMLSVAKLWVWIWLSLPSHPPLHPSLPSPSSSFLRAGFTLVPVILLPFVSVGLFAIECCFLSNPPPSATLLSLSHLLSCSPSLTHSL